MKLDYATRPGGLKLTREMQGLVWRRTAPFLDRIGMTKSLEHLLAEAYMQGMKDARTALDKDAGK